MSEKAIAILKAWLHGLRHLTHRGLTGYRVDGTIWLIRCWTCKRVFFYAPAQPESAHVPAAADKYKHEGHCPACGEYVEDVTRCGCPESAADQPKESK